MDVEFDFDKTKVELPDIKAVTEFLTKMQFYSFIKNINEILTSFNKEEAPKLKTSKNKPSKNNIEWSNRMLIDDDAHHRLESFEGEIPFDTYLKIDTSHMDAQTTAEKIKKHFKL